jgi:N-methylhydantoinase B
MSEVVVSRGRAGHADGSAIDMEVDPITTEVIRHGLNSAAEQMKRAFVRTSFSPIIYEEYDFGCALYDRDIRLLAQARGHQLFLGTMGFCIEGAVNGVGGEEVLEPGDIVLYNVPYGIGSHAQDCAVVMPVFYEDEVLLGYAAIKGHWLDIGAKDPYSTDTVDVFQEGTVFPGVKVYSRGEIVPDIYRMALANSRLPKAVAGDLNAEVVGVRTGAAGLIRVAERYGMDTFGAAVERIFDHGETVMRQYVEKIPDGRYTGQGRMDDNGIEKDEIPFEVVLEVDGSDVIVDYTNSPDAQIGPTNCPLPSTVSATRTAIASLVGGGNEPNEGHFRALSIRTRVGSMFHPEPPAPCYIYAWPAQQAIEVIFHAVSKAMPEAVPAMSGGDFCALLWWGVRAETGEPWGDAAGGNPVGQGGHPGASRGATLLHVGAAGCRLAPVEVWEAKNPWLLEHLELAPDSAGAGKFEGGSGLDMKFHMTEDMWMTSVVERTKNSPWGLNGGLEARPNHVIVHTPDGKSTEYGKVTRVPIPVGTIIELQTGGGGGYGEPSERDPDAVQRDIENGYITEAYARRHYPHALGSS